MAEIIFTLSDGGTRRVELREGVQTIGRDPSCEIALDDSSASRRHVMVRGENGRFYIEDLGSKNGTLVNNKPVQTAELHHLDQIVIGAVEARFLDASAPPSGGTVVLSDSPVRDQTTLYASRNEALVLSERRLKMIYELSDRLTKLRDRQVLLEDAIDACFEMLRFERAAICVRKARGRAIEWPVVRNLRGAGGELTISRSLLGRALDYGERSVFTEGQGSIDPTISMVQQGIRSAMCVPLMHEEEILGVIYGDRTSTGTTYTQEDVDFLAGLARQVSIGLINARLMDEQKSKMALEAELAVARNIQQRLFPRLVERDRGVDIAAMNEPGRLVSGDYYDFVDRSDGTLGFVIADVSGKGVAAALLMSNLQAAVRMTLPDCDDLARAVTRWNSLIYANTDESKFVTCLAGIVDPRQRRLTYVSAGHHLPLLLTPEGPQTIAAEDNAELPLGVMADVSYQAHTREIPPGPQGLLCYTDGVVEAMDPEGELFGEGRTLEALAGACGVGPESVIARMRKSLRTFCKVAPQSDDITIITMHLPEGGS